MPIFTGNGYRQFVSFSAPIRRVTNHLRAFLENGVEELQENEALYAELSLRCLAALVGARDDVNGGLGALPDKRNGNALVAPFIYEEEPTDEWRDLSALLEGRRGQSVYADCDCLSPMWGAWFYVRGLGLLRKLGADRAGLQRVGVGISQPKTRPCACVRSTCKGRLCKPGGVPQCRACGYGMAHAYTVLDGRNLPLLLQRFVVPMSGAYGARGLVVFDGSVLGGMGRPRPDFYGSGETAVRFLRDDPQ